MLTLLFDQKTKKDLKLEILNIAGQQVYSETLTSKVTQHDINLSTLSSGIYHVRVVDPETQLRDKNNLKTFCVK